MPQYDAWKTDDRAREIAEQLHKTFVNSDAYMSAYVDYCDEFESSDAYDKAFEQFVAGSEDGDEEPDDRDDVGYTDDSLGGMAYYGLHAEDAYDPFGDS